MLLDCYARPRAERHRVAIPAMSIDLDVQKDLHEAFRLLYDDEEDFDFEADSDEDRDATQLPGEEETRLEPEIRSTKYSKVSPSARNCESQYLIEQGGVCLFALTETTTSNARRLDPL